MSVFAYSQEIIVSNEGDTIACKITKVTNEYVHFAVYDNGIILMRSRLPLSEIKYYTPEQEKVDEEVIVTIPKEPTQDEKPSLATFDDPTFRFSIDGGFTYQFGGYDGMPDDYKNQLQTLWNIGGEAHYLLESNYGFGLTYSYWFTQAEGDIPTRNGVVEIRDELVRFGYWGVSALYSSAANENHVFNYFVSLGIVGYRTELMLDGDPYYQLGQSIGSCFGVSYDVRLMENIGVGLGVEILLSRIFQIDDNGTLIDSDFDISRVNLKAGLRIFK